MKRILSLTASILLSALILVSGTGLIIGKMTCLESGHTVVKTGEAKDCCKNEQPGTAIRNNCCAFNQLAISGGNFIPSSPHFIKTQLAAVVHFSNSFFQIAVTSPALFSSANYFSPPENPGQDFLSIYRI